MCAANPLGRQSCPVCRRHLQLYLKALLRGLFIGPAPDWELRQRLLAEASGQPPEYLHRRLAEVDPPAAARLHPHDTRRIVPRWKCF